MAQTPTVRRGDMAAASNGADDLALAGDVVVRAAADADCSRVSRTDFLVDAS